MQVQMTLPEWTRPRATAPVVAAEALPTGPLLVATSVAAPPDAVLRVAAALSARTGAGVEVVAMSANASAQEEPAHVAGAALARGAQAILVAQGPPGSAERQASGERVARLLRSVVVPVYSVHRDATGLARRVVIAMDFSVHAVRAAQAALRLIAPDAVVALVHVWSRIGTTPGIGRTYEHALPAMFDSLRVRLAAPLRIHLEPVSLVSVGAGAAICDYAEAAGADLVVSSTHGHGVIARLAPGSVAAQLLRDAPCSYLCIPGRHAARLPHAPAFRDVPMPFPTGG